MLDVVKDKSYFLKDPKEIYYKFNEYRRKAHERLLFHDVIYHRKRRCIEPEAVFAQIKHNSAWNRFRLRVMEKVKIAFLLVAIAHNLRKLAKIADFSPILSQITLVSDFIVQIAGRFNYPKSIHSDHCN